MEIDNNALFWQKIDTLMMTSSIVIKRNKGSHHPIYDKMIYPVDYGYLTDASSDSEQYLPIYIGSEKENIVKTIVISADILKKDIEVKLLLGCNYEEERKILLFLNQTDFQKSILIRRGKQIPEWAITK